MKLRKDDVAVITGAGGGIGKSVAIALAEKGLKTVLIDVNPDSIDGTAEVINAPDKVMKLPLDVSSREAMLAAAEETYDRFGKVNLLLNNAAVNGVMKPAWDIPHEDWQWVLGIDLFGVFYGIEAFVPKMVANDEQGMVINTTSIGGIISGPSSAYAIAKHAVTRLTEGLYYDFQQHASHLTAALLVPGPIITAINSNWGEMLDKKVRAQISEEEFSMMAEASQGVAAVQEQIGMQPEEVADILLNAIEEDQFYIYTHPKAIKEMAELRFNDFLFAKHPSTQAGDMEAMFAKWVAEGVQ